MSSDGVGVCRHPRFLLAWAGQVSGAIGDQLVPVALALHVAQQGGDVADVGLVLGGRAIALVVFLLLGGLFADRLRRSRLIVAADAYRTVLVVAAAFAIQHVPVGWLFVVTILVGGGEAFARPAYRALVPGLLPDELLERGNALVSAGLRSSAVLGSLVGATVVATTGVRVALLLAAATFAVGACTVWRIREPTIAKPGGSLLSDAASGVRTVRERPWMCAVMIAVCLQIMTGSAAALSLLPVIAHRTFEADFAYGLVLAAMGLGALPAVALAGKWRPARPGRVSMLALTCYALVPLSLIGPGPLPAVALAFGIGGFVVELYFVYWQSALQREVPQAVLGKVMALAQLGSFALLPLGFALVGPVVALLGENGTLLLCGMVVAGSSLLALAVPGVAAFRGAPASQAP